MRFASTTTFAACVEAVETDHGLANRETNRNEKREEHLDDKEGVNVMRKCALGMLIVLALGSSALGITPDEIASLRTEKLTEKLQLSADQAGQAQGIMVEVVGKLEKLVTDTSGDRRQMRDAVRALEMDARTRIADALSDEQHDSLFQMRRGILPELRMIELNQRLDLTSEQFAGIERIMESFRERMPRPGRGKPGASQQTRDERKALMDRQDSEIKALLTDTQRDSFAQMKRKPDKPRGDRKPRQPGKR